MSDQQDYRVTDVFTPTTPARATFVERASVNDKLVDALQTPGKQVVVYGHSGSGKTTLLVNKLEQLFEDHITTRCTSKMTFDAIVFNAFDQLSAFAVSESVTKKTTQFSGQLAVEYMAIKMQLGTTDSSEDQMKWTRVLPPQLTTQTLARFLGEAKCCWLLEDFHKIADEQKALLAQSMKLFMDMADTYRDLKIIAIGAVDTARQVIEYDPEMRNRVAEVYVPLMTSEELRQIIDRGESLLRFHVAGSVKHGIVLYSNGLASACHQLCLNICNAAGIVKTLPHPTVITQPELDKALQMYIEQASDTLKGAFDKGCRQKRAGRFDNCRLILDALASCDAEGAVHSELLAVIRKKHRDYPPGNLTQYLNELQTPERGQLIRKDTNSGRISFTDPVYRVFAQAVARKPAKATEKVTMTLDQRSELTALITKYILESSVVVSSAPKP